jgi:hypothetical protein
MELVAGCRVARMVGSPVGRGRQQPSINFVRTLSVFDDTSRSNTSHAQFATGPLTIACIRTIWMYEVLWFNMIFPCSRALVHTEVQ